MSFRGRKGFTLIELLVVISIIALLIGLLLPALGAARQQAVIAQCLANQRQVGIGFHQYITEWEGLIPGLNGNNWGQSDNFGIAQGQNHYGRLTLWLPYTPTGGYWEPSYSASWQGATPVGLGYVYQPLAGESPNPTTSGLNGVGKIFYCPGTSASYNLGPAIGDEYDGSRALYPSRAWYKTFTAGFGTQPDAGDATKGGAFGTYFYRSGAYYTNRWPTTSVVMDYQTLYKSDHPNVFDKAVSACYSPPGWGYPPGLGYPGWMGSDGGRTDRAFVAHNGTLVNLLWSDGSAKSYRPGAQNGYSFDRGLAAWFDNNTLSEAAYQPYGQGTSPNYGYGMLPWFWVMADQGR